MAASRIATYRIQLTPDVGFADVVGRLDHLRGLGVSHVYLSPVTEAVPGSTHGYDVVDHGAVRAELGGADGLFALLDAAAERDMAVLVDHVPNHVAVGRPELNRPWWALLRDGEGSAASRWFDVDWDGGGGRVVLPVLGEPLDELLARRDVEVVAGDDGGRLRIGELHLPLAEGTASLAPMEAVGAQHYRLVYWRSPERNVRRFFTIDDLVAVCVEHEEVAVVVDTVPRLLADHPGFGGVRVDHVDGLADPGAYLADLRAIVGPDRWVLVEKILAPDERLPAPWPVDGTTGYEHAAVLEHAMLDRAGWATMADRWQRWTGDARPFRAWELEARREVLAAGLRPDVERVGRLARRVLDVTDATDAVAELCVHLRRYRTYLPDDPAGRVALAEAGADAGAARPDLAATIDALASAIDAPADDEAIELRTRWQQLTGPATAKGVEDRAYFRWGPLASLAEVGNHPEPDRRVDPVAALHEHHAVVAERWPTTLLAGTTHDMARSDDVRATGLALAGRSDAWAALLDLWEREGRLAEGVAPDTQWLALQTAVTAPGIGVERLTAFLVKAAREAELHSSWANPSASFERRLGELAGDVLAWMPVTRLAASLDRVGRAVSLALLAVRATAPGVPDHYQGAEAFRAVLVDPDNRVEPDQAELVDIGARAADVDGPGAWVDPSAGTARAVVIERLLALRRERIDALGPTGGYRSIPAEGPGADDVIAFTRTVGDEAAVITVAPRAVVPVRQAELPLPPGRWRHVLVDDAPLAEGHVELTPAFATFPAVVLVRR